MLRYLNGMSARGLHIKRLRRFKNEFDENKDERYLYAICCPETEDYYKEVDGWERLFEYKALVFYKKRLPREFVSIKKPRLYKKPLKERLWLNERLKDGMLLFGKAEGEYIFRRYDPSERAEYFTDYIPHGKDPDVYLYEKALDGFECVSPSTDGTTYYFVKIEGKQVVRGLKNTKKREKLKKRRMLLSLTAFVLIIAAFTATFIAALRFGKGASLCFYVGAPLSFISFLTFLIFKRSYGNEKRRRIEEEWGLSKPEVKEEEKNEINPEENNDEGDKENSEEQGGERKEEADGKKNEDSDEKKTDGTSGAAPLGLPLLPLTVTDDSDEWHYIDEDGEDVRANESEASDSERDGFENFCEDKDAFGGFLRYQLISSIFFLTVYCAGAVAGIAYAVRYFAFKKSESIPLLVLSIAAAVFLPFMLYFGIGASRWLVLEIRKRKDSADKE